MDNTAYLLLAIGVIGLVGSLLLFFTGKKVEIKNDLEFDKGKISICNKNLDLFAFLYVFIVIMMLLISILSRFYQIIIFGCVPLLIFIIYTFINKEEMKE